MGFPMSLLQKCQGGGPGLPYMGSVRATALAYSMANFFKMTFARGSYTIKLNPFFQKGFPKNQVL